MVVTPNSRIRLLKTPIEIDERNQLTFASLTAQTEYFLGLTYLEEDDATYVRKDNVIRFPTDPTGTTYEDLLKYNYCMYQNTSYDSKWFYAFITGIKYINDGMSEITIETDVIETWKFDIVYKPSFIEREHTNDDTRGANLVPEGLETGEYKSQFVSVFPIGTSHIVMATNISPVDGTTPVSGGVYGGIVSGVSYYVFQSESDLFQAILRMTGRVDAISSIFYCPDFITNYANLTFTNGVAEITNITPSITGISVPLTPSTIDGYTPKNNKLFTYPYVGYVLSNNSGGSMIYHLEDFKDNTSHLGEIKVYGTCTPGASVRAIPVNYRCEPTTLTNTENNEYGLTLGKFPIASFPVDTYINWLTTECVNIAVDFGEDIVSGISSSATANVGGTVNALGSMLRANQEMNKKFMRPVEARGNLNSGDVTYTIGMLTYTGYLQTIKSEFARIIDDFFSMYGYKTNRVKVPNIEGRTNWNYVKTIDINITGEIPQEDMQKIKDIFNNGITFWHNPSTFLDYSQSNTIVS